jgi:hypothetical protein
MAVLITFLATKWYVFIIQGLDPFHVLVDNENGFRKGTRDIHVYVDTGVGTIYFIEVFT